MALLEDVLPGEDDHLSVDTGPHAMIFLGPLPRGPQQSRSQLPSFPSPEKPSVSAVASPSFGFPEGWVLGGGGC